MNLRHLQFFTTAVECQGITRAAERLRLSQPAVTAGIRALEAELGHRLFERSPGGRAVRPTETGRAFYGHALDILGRCEAARRQLGTQPPAPRSLRVGVLRTLAVRWVADLAAGLAARATDWRWRFREGSPNQLLDWLVRGRIDLACTLVEAEGPETRLLWSEPYVALVGRDHRLAERERITVADLAGERLVLRGACEMRPGILQAAGLDLRAAAVVHRDALALALVGRGIGVAVGPRSYAGAGIAGIPMAELAEARSVGLRWRGDVPAAAVDAVLAAAER